MVNAGFESVFHEAYGRLHEYGSAVGKALRSRSQKLEAISRDKLIPLRSIG